LVNRNARKITAIGFAGWLSAIALNDY